MNFETLERAKVLKEKIDTIKRRIEHLKTLHPGYRAKGYFYEFEKVFSQGSIEACRAILINESQRELDTFQAGFNAL